MTLQSIVGKYFITILSTPTGGRGLIRGQILGPLFDPSAPVFLCRMYPQDDPDKPLPVPTLATEMVLTLEQLVSVPLFADVEVWEHVWGEHVKNIYGERVARKRSKRAAAAAAATVTQPVDPATVSSPADAIDPATMPATAALDEAMSTHPLLAALRRIGPVQVVNTEDGTSYELPQTNGGPDNPQPLQQPDAQEQHDQHPNDDANRR